MILAPTNIRNWVEGKLWQIQKEQMGARQCQAFGTTAQWVAWAAVPISFLYQVMSKTIWWWDRQRTLCDTGTMNNTGTSTYITHTFLIFMHRRKWNYSEFQHQLLHTGKGLQIYLDGYQCFLGSCCLPSWEPCFLLLSTSIRRSHSCQVKANTKGTCFSQE